MNNTVKHQKTIIDHLLWIHNKTSSWVAAHIGPVVFNYGTNDKHWNLNTRQLLQYPEGSVGKALGRFLSEYDAELLTGAEYHDIEHVLFDFSMSFKDEVALQFFLHGNGQKSIASYSTLIGAWFILPLHWKYLRAAYAKGKQCKDVSKLNLRSLLDQNLNETKATLFQ